MIPNFSDVNVFLRDPLGFLSAKGTGAQSFAKLNLGWSRIFLLCDAELVKPILKSESTLVDKGHMVRKLERIIGRSSLTMATGEHQDRREILHKVLSRGRVEAMTPEILSIIRQQVFRILDVDDCFDPHRFGSVIALKVITTILFGRNVLTDADERALFEAVRLVEDDLSTEMFRALPPMPWTAYRIRQERAVAKRIMETVVQKVRAKASTDSVMHQLYALGLNDKEVREEILMMLLGGHHTVGAAVGWLLYHMATEPKLLATIAAEGEQILDKAGDLDPTKLRYAKSSAGLSKEILRLYPSFWWFSREVLQPHQIDGHSFKKGDTIMIAPWVLHRTAKYWDAPESLNIERDFSNKAYIPFGAGPRACTGMGLAMLELQLIALEIALAFDITVAEVQTPLQPKASIALLPPAIKLRLNVRENMVAESYIAA